MSNITERGYGSSTTLSMPSHFPHAPHSSTYTSDPCTSFSNEVSYPPVTEI